MLKPKYQLIVLVVNTSDETCINDFTLHPSYSYGNTVHVCSNNNDGLNDFYIFYKSRDFLNMAVSDIYSMITNVMKQIAESVDDPNESMNVDIKAISDYTNNDIDDLVCEKINSVVAFKASNYKQKMEDK